MTESKRDEHQRLQERTDELAGEHDALGLDRKGFMMIWIVIARGHRIPPG